MYIYRANDSYSGIARLGCLGLLCSA